MGPEALSCELFSPCCMANNLVARRLLALIFFVVKPPMRCRVAFLLVVMFVLVVCRMWLLSIFFLVFGL